MPHVSAELEALIEGLVTQIYTLDDLTKAAYPRIQLLLLLPPLHHLFPEVLATLAFLR